jgi:predicted RNase H-like HicB family nuclease
MESEGRPPEGEDQSASEERGERMSASEELERILSAPYARLVIPDVESGTFTGRILEFPGCVSQGDSAEEAYRNLEEAGKEWVRAALDLGQEIPAAFEDRSFSGRVLVRFPSSIHRRAVELAERENTSLNQLIVSAVSERLGVAEVTGKLLDRLEERLSDEKVNRPRVALS